MNSFLKSSSLVFFVAWMSTPAAVCADWNIRNNLGERFTIYVWPSNNPSGMQSRTLENGQEARIALGSDQHEIELLSKGGDLYILEPASLRNRQGITNLKTILTPKDKKVRGRTVYQYMNQQGFNAGDSDRLSQLEWSAWRTTYDTPDGKSVKTDLKFAGSVGSYNGGRGKLSDIKYQHQDGHTLISGRWVFNNRSSGQFTFFVNDNNSNQFTSTRDGRNSNWSGERRNVAP